MDVERAFSGPATGASAPSRPAPASIPRAGKAKPVFKMETAPAESDGDFFDLAGELDKTLADVQVAVDGNDDGGPEETHSIDEIFRAFRKGVEQQVDAQDYETHYNLGIAYKEMGLIDEAIAEFQYAAKDRARTVECCGILGLCFREKGMAPLALKWFQKGLDMPDIGESEAMGLRYDMAEVYLEQGDYDRALELYTEVYGFDSTYREVSGRLKEVRKQANS
jgi:tetratricopeptide (TPR) repeat protein